ncbi:MAG: alpha/beta fold hydrolase [Saprospiraceae bacterium]|nr:alpha/beta fold hydrolase [Saprospiraceae bacterium]
MQLHFKSFGSGDPIIILHGMLGMLDNWQSFGRELSTNHLVYLIDLRNHGKSDHNQTISYTEMANDVRETMESQWMYDGAIVMGHSMGGKTAMQLALDHPSLVKMLIVVDIAPVQYQGGHEKIIEALQNINFVGINSRQEISDQLADKIDDKSIVNFLMKNLSRSKDGSFAWKMNLKAIANGYSNLLAAPTYSETPYIGPTLFIKGANSNYLASDYESRIRTWFPNAVIKTIAGAGHWVHADQPVQLKKVLEDFISEHHTS